MNKKKISSENLNKELAYLLGVYLSDGCIASREKPSPGCSFRLNTIDYDFADNTLNCLNKIMSNCKGNINKYIVKPTGFSKGGREMYSIGVGFTVWRDFFENQTGKKHHIPTVIWNAPLIIKKWFIAGVMDGDGWIAIAVKNRVNPRFNIGVGKAEESWIWEFKQLLEKLNVKINKPEIIPAGYRNHTIPFVRFKVNTRSFISAGLFFTIERKQKRLKYAIKILKNIEERNY